MAKLTNSTFTLISKDTPENRQSYEKCMRKLSKFFGIRWIQDRPKIFLVANKRTIKDLRDGRVADWVQGWTNYKTSSVYMLATKEGRKRGKIDYYLSGLLHEIAHLFFLKLAKVDEPHPIWLWEGVSLFLDGHTKQSKWNPNLPPKKLEDFMKYYDRHKLPGREQEAGVYRESGFAVEFLVKNFGKKKLLDLIKSLAKTKTKTAFAKKFKEIYGFKLNYSNFNPKP